MSGILHHCWLLLTLRHNGAGLNVRGLPTIAALISLSCLLAYARWHIDLAVTHGIMLGLISLFDRRVAAGFALLSVAVDAMAVSAMAFGVPHDALAWGIWELAGAAALVGRVQWPA